MLFPDFEEFSLFTISLPLPRVGLESKEITPTGPGISITVFVLYRCPKLSTF
jgi:hypothetical protein